MVLVCFAVGMLASSFSSVDSAMTAMTTSFLSDILGVDAEKVSPKFRHRVHLGVAVAVCLVVMLLDFVRSDHAIDVIYQLVSYLYGPLLGMFAYCVFRRGRDVVDSVWIVVVAVFSPVLSYATSKALHVFCGYDMGYELLLLNGLITYLGLVCVRWVTSVGRS